MTFQEYLQTKNMTGYRLSKCSGVPKTTVTDICTGKSALEKCTAGTVKKLAEALDCSMEFLVNLEIERYDSETGLPKDRQHLEYALPEYLQSSISRMCDSWKILDAGGTDMQWDMNWCELNADINAAEVEQEITPEQAWYLREKYLRMERGE